jgi:hypothetical protein
MKSSTHVIQAILSALLTLSSDSPGQIITNESFEIPNIPTNSFEYNPSGATWIFTGNSGLIDGTGSGFLSQPSPDGLQHAFLQFSGSPSSFSQSISLASDSLYRLTFLDAGRRDNTIGAFGNLPYDVLIDATVIGSRTTTTGEAFTTRTFDFFATAGAHSITFRTTSAPTSDNTAFFDSVTIAAVPEPATAVTICAGLSLVLTQRRRRHP